MQRLPLPVVALCLLPGLVGILPGCAANMTRKEIEGLFDREYVPGDVAERDDEPRSEERPRPAPPPVRTDETRALELSDVSWVDTDKKKRKRPPPGRHVPCLYDVS